MSVIRFSKWEYREYLKSDHWAALRESKLREKPICERCRALASREVHHMRYKSIYDVHCDDLAALCQDCHAKVERAKRMKMLPKEHSISEIVDLTDEKMSSIQSRRMTRHVLTGDFVAFLDRMHLNPFCRISICRILGLPNPTWFVEWEGIKVTGARWRKVQFALSKIKAGTWNPRNHRKGANTQKRSKIRIHY